MSAQYLPLPSDPPEGDSYDTDEAHSRQIYTCNDKVMHVVPLGRGWDTLFIPKVQTILNLLIHVLQCFSASYIVLTISSTMYSEGRISFVGAVYLLCFGWMVISGDFHLKDAMHVIMNCIGVSTSPDGTYQATEGLPPEDLARVVRHDETVNFAPLGRRIGSPSVSTRVSVFPRDIVIQAFLSQCCWIFITDAILWTSIRMPQLSVSLLLFAAFIRLGLYVFQTLLLTSYGLPSLYSVVFFTVNVLTVLVLQTICTVQSYYQGRDYFVRNMIILGMAVPIGAYLICVVYSCSCKASKAAVTGEIAQDSAVDSNAHTTEKAASRMGPTYIEVRRSLLPRRLRIVAMLISCSWLVIIFVFPVASLVHSVNNRGLYGFFMSVERAFELLFVFLANFHVVSPAIPLIFAAVIFAATSLQLATTVTCSGDSFALNFKVLVGMVLYGLVSVYTVFLYHYRAGQVALAAAATESDALEKNETPEVIPD